MEMVKWPIRSRRYLVAKEVERLASEIVSEEEIPWYVVDQDEAWRVWFDMGSSFLLVCLVFYIPFAMAFSEAADYLVFDWFVFAWFALDIVLSSVTTYNESNGKKVTDPSKILKHYLRGYFVLDLVATVPWTLCLGRHSQTDASHLGPILKSLKLPRLARALRFFPRYTKLRRGGVPDLGEVFPRLFPPVVGQLSKFLAVALVLNHLFACAWYALGDKPHKESCLIEGDRGRRDCSWMQVGGFRPRDGNFYLYTTCLYWSITTVTTVGYGDLRPNTAHEKLFAVFVMVCGVTFNTTLIGAMGKAVLDSNGQQDKGKAILRAYLYRQKVPADLCASVLSYLRHHHTVDNDFDPDVWRLLKHLNRPLMRELTLHVCRSVVKKLDFFFRAKDPTFVADCVIAMRAYVASPEEILVTKNNLVTTLNLIAQGTCQATSRVFNDDSSSNPPTPTTTTTTTTPPTPTTTTTTKTTTTPPPQNKKKAEEEKQSDNQEIWRLTLGDCFGDEGILSKASWREPLVASSWCELQIIPETTISKLLDDFPSVKAQLLHAATLKLRDHPTILARCPTFHMTSSSSESVLFDTPRRGPLSPTTKVVKGVPTLMITNPRLLHEKDDSSPEEVVSQLRRRVSDLEKQLADAKRRPPDEPQDAPAAKERGGEGKDDDPSSNR